MIEMTKYFVQVELLHPEKITKRFLTQADSLASAGFNAVSFAVDFFQKQWPEFDGEILHGTHYDYLVCEYIPEKHNNYLAETYHIGNDLYAEKAENTNQRNLRPKFITKQKFMELIRVKDYRTIDTYVKEGLLEAPECRDDEYYFDTFNIMEALGLKKFPKEFITTTELSEAIDMAPENIRVLQRRGVIPSYKIKASKGSSDLYILEEVKEALGAKLIYDPRYASKQAINEYIEHLVRSIHKLIIPAFNIGISDEAVEMLNMVVLEGATYSDVGKKYNLSNEGVRQLLLHATRKIRASVSNISTVFEERDALMERNKKYVADIKLYQSVADDFCKNIKEIDNGENPDFFVDAMPLSTRGREVLLGANAIHGNKVNLTQLLKFSVRDLRKFRNCGQKTITELSNFVEGHGYRLKGY